MQITKSQIRKMIKEEVTRLTVEEEKSKGLEMANGLFEQFANLDSSNQQIFLENFVKLVNDKIS
ncbi:MAG: hypothetical protein HOJ16_08180 [Candidatus Peribacter sp.]|jgi:hypothetical protein|nr:hypothetical protein [Candidatus Peribacter sp.]